MLVEASADARGRSFVKIVEKYTSSHDQGSVIAVGDTLGEYQISLDAIDYTYCDTVGSQKLTYVGKSQDRVCAMNFSVTDGFYMHKGSPLTTTTNTELERYKSLEGENIVSQEQIDRISGSTRSAYTSADIRTLSQEFVDTYVVRAQKSAILDEDIKAYTLLTDQ